MSKVKIDDKVFACARCYIQGEPEVSKVNKVNQGDHVCELLEVSVWKTTNWKLAVFTNPYIQTHM